MEHHAEQELDCESLESVPATLSPSVHGVDQSLQQHQIGILNTQVAILQVQMQKQQQQQQHAQNSQDSQNQTQQQRHSKGPGKPHPGKAARAKAKSTTKLQKAECRGQSVGSSDTAGSWTIEDDVHGRFAAGSNNAVGVGSSTDTPNCNDSASIPRAVISDQPAEVRQFHVEENPRDDASVNAVAGFGVGLSKKDLEDLERLMGKAHADPNVAKLCYTNFRAPAKHFGIASRSASASSRGREHGEDDLGIEASPGVAANAAAAADPMTSFEAPKPLLASLHSQGLQAAAPPSSIESPTADLGMSAPTDPIAAPALASPPVSSPSASTVGPAPAMGQSGAPWAPPVPLATAAAAPVAGTAPATVAKALPSAPPKAVAAHASPVVAPLMTEMTPPVAAAPVVAPPAATAKALPETRPKATAMHAPAAKASVAPPPAAGTWLDALADQTARMGHTDVQTSGGLPVFRSTFQEDVPRFGVGWVAKDTYQSRCGFVHDTRKPPPGSCFNCGEPHWRKDCPRHQRS